MFSDDGRYVLVYNGEIYNYIELRQELASKYNFQTRTDTEVLMNAYREWGAACLHRFNGMFAFVIYDLKEKTFFGARDRFGIKPFYYYIDPEQFIFASEIAPILKVLKPKPEADERSIFDYLVYNRTDQTERTFFKSIKKLQHGHLFSFQNGQLNIRQWYALRDRISTPFTDAHEFRQTLSSAIKLRLRSDVPVGVCLSGGLDSSSIVSLILQDHHQDDLKTFSAVYGNGNRADESEFINEYRDQLRNMYFTFPTAETLYQDMYQYVQAHTEPTPGTGPYAQFKVMERAKGNVVVTLDGQGADEELAGYHYFFGFFFKDLFLKFRWLKLFQEMYCYLRQHQSLYGLKSFAFFLLPASLKTKTRIREKNYINFDFSAKYSDGSVIAENLYASRSLNDALINHFEYKLEHLLKWEDRNSMWFSLESRVPFLDFRLVERALALPGEMVINQGMTKHILRESMRQTLPEKIRTRRDKNGFDTPEDDWFRSDNYKNFIFDLIQSRKFKERGYYNLPIISQRYQKHLDRQMNISKEIWKWINLELWFQEFIDKAEQPL
jgi:asparagine synthase (glutamine-hydrolysing)